MDNTQKIKQKEGKKGFSGLQVLGIVLAAIVLTVLLTLAAAWAYLFPRPFKPVVLTPVEQQQLEAKLDRVEAIAGTAPPGMAAFGEKSEEEGEYTADGRLQPRPYTEDKAAREVSFSEREVNAMIATNTDLADKFAVDLADNLVSARMLVPVDPDFPVFRRKNASGQGRGRGGLSGGQTGCQASGRQPDGGADTQCVARRLEKH